MCLEYIEAFLNEHAWSPETRERYKRAVSQFIAEIGDTSSVTASSFRSWLINHPWGDNMRWLVYNAVRNYLVWRYGNGHPALKLKIKRGASPPQRALNQTQVLQLLSSFNTMTEHGIRDLAIATLLLDSGLRCSEVCRLELRRVDLEARCFAVVIKGGNWGEGVFSATTARFIADWIGVRGKIVKPETKTLFCSIGGLTRGKPLTRYGLGCIIHKWGRRAGLGLLSPHDFRRTFAVLSTRLGAPSRVLQVAGRWSSLTMVERYTSSISAHDFEPYFPVEAILTK